MELNIDQFKSQYVSKYPQSKGSPNLYNDAFKVYNHALKNPGRFCIFGRLGDIEKILGKPQVLEGKSILAVEGTTLSFFITNESQAGNVLHADCWTTGVNDAWVLGGIHGRSTFNFIFDQSTIGGGILTLGVFIDKYIRSGSAAYPTTITARELLGLKCAGYVPEIKHNMLVLSPTYKYEPMDFNKYYTNVENFKDEALVKVITDYLSPAFSSK